MRFFLSFSTGFIINNIYYFAIGYATGYLLAALINYAVSSTGSSWRILFWTGSVFALLAVFIRIFVPESQSFEQTKEVRKLNGASYVKELMYMLKNHYRRKL